MINVHFDTRSDAGGRDPDLYSATLRKYHERLWVKSLPDGRELRIDHDQSKAYLPVQIGEQRFLLASDTIVNSNRGRLKPLYEQMGLESNAHFHREGMTVRGAIVFPGNKVDGRQTINQRRGMHPHICDRIDLTLECIRRHYDGRAETPLSETLKMYTDFFKLFGSFTQYVEFFHLEDLVDESSRIRFFFPFTEFGQNVLPRTFGEYERYRANMLEFVEARGRRIEAWDRANLSAEGA
ncbi:DUF6994 family protein [Humidisolicoccus flavus]|uniref:DUF6994 family protein n=1 Tax=Humidisolicoccus flavus TaxID=3111414 RepID=UPI003247BACC